MRLDIRQPIRQAIRQSVRQIKAVAEQLGPNILNMSGYQKIFGKNLSFDATTQKLTFDASNAWGELSVRFPVALSAGKKYKIIIEQNALLNHTKIHVFDEPILSIKYANITTEIPPNWTQNNYYGAFKKLNAGISRSEVDITIPTNADTTGCKIGLTEPGDEHVTVKVTVQEII